MWRDCRATRATRAVTATCWPSRIQHDTVAMMELSEPATRVGNVIMEFSPLETIIFLLSAIGPLKVTIVCATLTADASPEFLKRVALRSVLIALIVCMLFAVLGEVILRAVQSDGTGLPDRWRDHRAVLLA